MTATGGHPFWVSDKAAWVEAKDLVPGDDIRTAEDRSSKVTATARRTEHLTVYNLTVDGLHTYYVQAGDASVLVHNCGLSNNASPEKQRLEIDAAQKRNVTPAVMREGTGYGGLRDALGGETDFKWAVVAGEAGSHELRVMPAYAGGRSAGDWPRMEMAHTVLAGFEGKVLSAGSGNLDDLFQMASINNWSGHFEPGEELMGIAEAAFGRAGIETITVPRG
ncbi:intein [Lentzea atacamensis]|uniref:Intein n=1 Tax=Lentzea atacamensis TaxID=531938 RepID=A0A316I7V4_9PSEU|nr:polymorphic toxin-type HINT domain-containing protein [Lentzea atacamensis]PWK89119.1 intein [Lentzea atacamensis]RAS61839.1 intein [Lentzea atacamensis]